MWRVVLLAMLMIAACVIYSRRVETFKFNDGWLAQYGDALDWLTPPIWLERGTEPPAPTASAEQVRDLIFDGKNLFLVAFEGPKGFGRLAARDTALAGQPSAPTHVAQSRREIWALIPNPETKTYYIRNSSGKGAFLTVDRQTCSPGLRGDAFGEWTLEPAGDHQFYVRTRGACDDGSVRYLGVLPENRLAMLADKPEVPWTIKPVVGPKNPETTKLPRPPIGTIPPIPQTPTPVRATSPPAPVRATSPPAPVRATSPPPIAFMPASTVSPTVPPTTRSPFPPIPPTRVPAIATPPLLTITSPPPSAFVIR